MGGLSVSHWLIVLLVVFLLFGPGRISAVMGDFGKGLRSFRKGLTDEDESGTSVLSQANSTMALTGPESEAEIKPE